MGDALTSLSSAHCWVCGVSQCHHLHVTDLATKSQILQMNPNDFLKFFLIFLPQLLKSHFFTLVLFPPLELKMVCVDLC